MDSVGGSLKRPATLGSSNDIPTASIHFRRVSMAFLTCSGIGAEFAADRLVVVR